MTKLNREKQLGLDEALTITKHVLGGAMTVKAADRLSQALADRYRIEHELDGPDLTEDW